MRRLVETAFPLATVNDISSAEKKRTQGTITNLVTWFARRPQTASRAILLAMVLPDPNDEKWDETFLQELYERASDLVKPRASLTYNLQPFSRQNLLNTSLDLVERCTPQFAEDNESSPLDKERFWRKVRELVVFVNKGEPPSFLDCFAGGGTLPLEARRLGMMAHATDINPLPLAINTFQLGFNRVDRHGLEQRILAEAQRINERANERLGHLYPLQDGEEVIAILRARCIPCANCGVTYPLLRSRYVVDDADRKIAYSFVERDGRLVVDRLDHQASAGLTGTVEKGKATCPECNHLMENETVQAALTERNGDTQTSLPLALVIAHRDTQPTTTQQVSLLSFGSESGPVETVQSDESRASKAYLAVDEHFFQAEQEALRMLNIVLQDQEARTFLPIDEELPEQGSMGTGVQQFGMTRFYDLYTVRQLLSFSTLAEEIKQVEDEQVRTILAFALAKLADQNSSLAGWQPSTQHFPNVFGMNAIQMSWDFYELNPFQDTLGARWMGRVRQSVGAFSVATADGIVGSTQYADARSLPFDDDSMDMFGVDPPYYAKVPYNYLSNYYLVWLNRVLDLEGVEASTGLASNEKELIEETSNTGNKKSRESYTDGMSSVIKELGRIMKPDGIGCLVFGADLDGWNSVLEPLVNEGLTVTASWPIISERKSRQRARDSSVNNASIHLILRRTPEARDPQRFWSEVREDCRAEYEVAYTQLNEASISGGDLTWACIGPLLKAWSKTETVIDDYLETTLDLKTGLERMHEQVVVPVILAANKEVQALAQRTVALDDLAALVTGAEETAGAWEAFCSGEAFEWTQVLAYLGENDDVLRGADSRAAIDQNSISMLRIVLDILIPSLPMDHKVRKQLDRFSIRLQMDG